MLNKIQKLILILGLLGTTWPCAGLAPNTSLQTPEMQARLCLEEIGHYVKQNQYQNVIEAASRGLSLDPSQITTNTRARIYYELSWALESSGRTQEAIIAAQQGLAIDQTNVSPHTLALLYQELSLAFNATGHYQEAIAAAKKGLSLDQHRISPQVLALLFHELSWALNTIGNDQEAVAAAKKGLRLDPSRIAPETLAMLYHACSWALTAIGNGQEAILAARSGLNLDPAQISPETRAKLHYALSLALHTIKNNPEAIHVAQQGLSLNPEQVSPDTIALLHYVLALTLNASGKCQEAIEATQRGLALNQELIAPHTLAMLCHEAAAALKNLKNNSACAEMAQKGLIIAPEGSQILKLLQALQGSAWEKLPLQERLIFFLVEQANHFVQNPLFKRLPLDKAVKDSLGTPLLTVLGKNKTPSTPWERLQRIFEQARHQGPFAIGKKNANHELLAQIYLYQLQIHTLLENKQISLAKQALGQMKRLLLARNVQNETEELAHQFLSGQATLFQGQLNALSAKAAEGSVEDTPLLATFLAKIPTSTALGAFEWNAFPKDDLRQRLSSAPTLTPQQQARVPELLAQVQFRVKTAQESAHNAAALFNSWHNGIPEVVFDERFGSLPQALQNMLILNELFQLIFAQPDASNRFVQAENADLQIELASIISVALAVPAEQFAAFVAMLPENMELSFNLSGSETITLDQLLQILQQQELRAELLRFVQENNLLQTDDLFASIQPVVGMELFTAHNIAVLKAA